MGEEIGMVTCNICKGKKYLSVDKGYHNNYVTVKISGFSMNKPVCTQCNGTGKITWIEQVFCTQKHKQEEQLEERFKGFWDLIYTNHKKKDDKNIPWKHWSDKSKRVT